MERVDIVAYDPTWPAVFDRIRASVGDAVGSLALSIEHVGSTAVPGLAAKPIVDIDIIVRSLDDVPETIRRLAGIGYIHEGDKGVPGREAFVSPIGTPAHHLYVCAANNAKLRDHLRLRDYLRAHPAAAEEYARVKRALANSVGHDREAYTEGKSEFIEAALRPSGE